MEEIKISNDAHVSPDIVTESGQNKIRVKATIGAVGVGEIYGWDLYPTAWAILGGTITTDDWVKITIDGYDSQYTVLAGDTWDDITSGLAAAINANANINSKVDSYAHYKQVHVRGDNSGDEFEGLSISTSVSGTATITSVVNAATISQRWKKILIEEDPNDRRYGWLGIYGDVGSRTKAENPIHICVRKEIATQSEIVFADKTVPSDVIWYITNVAVADDLATEFKTYQGFARDQVEYFSGNDSTETFTLSKQAVANAGYILVKIGGVTKTLGSDYVIQVSNDSDSEKSDIEFTMAQPPVTGTDNIEVTYDTVKLVLGLHLPVNSSQTFEFGAPVKLAAGEFIIVSVSNKSSNTGAAIANINGFFEEVH